MPLLAASYLVINPCFINPCFVNPCCINPCFINPCFINPCFINPCCINPCFTNPVKLIFYHIPFPRNDFPLFIILFPLIRGFNKFFTSGCWRLIRRLWQQKGPYGPFPLGGSRKIWNLEARKWNFQHYGHQKECCSSRNLRNTNWTDHGNGHMIGGGKPPLVHS